MEIDVLYRVPTDLCWQYINGYIRKETANLILFRSCPDNFVTKKTIWNAASRIVPSGIFCIQAHPENISHVIQLLEEKGFKYRVTYVDMTWADDSTVLLFVIAYKSELAKPNMDKLVHVESYDDLASKLINLSDFGDIVVCVGDGMLPFVDRAKILGRQVVAFGDDELWSSRARLQGIREIEL